MKNKTKSLMNLLYALIAILVALFLITLSPDILNEIWKQAFIFCLFVFGGAFMILGFLLGIQARKYVQDKKLRRFLMLAGFSAGSFLILTVAHNLFYGMAEIFKDITIIKYIATAMEVISFVVSTLVLPVTFLIGAIGSIVVYYIEKKKSQ